MSSENDPKELPKLVASGNLYTGICTVRSSDVQYRWTIVVTALVLTLPALAAFPSRYEASYTMFQWLANFNITLGALLLSIFLDANVKRITEYIAIANSALARIESTNGTEGGVRFFSSEEWQTLYTRRGTTSRWTLRAVSIGCCYVWGIMFAVSFIKLAAFIA